MDIPDSQPDNNEVIRLFANQPPNLFPVRLSVMASDLPLLIPLSADDPNGDSVTFSLVPHAHATLVEGHSVSFNSGGAPGSYLVEYTATDPDGAAATAPILIEVYGEPVPAQPPVILSPSAHGR